MNQPEHLNWKKIAWKTCAAAIILVILIVLGRHIGPYIPHLEYQIEQMGPWAPVIFTIGFIVLCALFFPADALVLAAGAMFDFTWGFVYAGIATVLGATFMFLVARTGLKSKIEKILEKHPKLQVIDAAMGQEGFRLMFLLRLSPVPYAILSYMLSVCRVRFLPYILATVGMLISNIPVVYYGFVAKHLMKYAGRVEDKSTMHYVFLVIGVGVAIFTTVYVTFIVKRALRRYAQENESSDASSVGQPSA